MSVEKKVEGDKRVNYFTWGERAHLEVDRSKMLGLMAGVGATRTHAYRHTHTERVRCCHTWFIPQTILSSFMKVPLTSGRRDTKTFWLREKEGIQKRRGKTLWRLDG